EAQNRDDVFVAIFMSIGLVIVSAIIFFGLPSHNLYMGYIHPIIYHNVNYVMLRVFALLLFLRLAASFHKEAGQASLSSILLTAFLVVLSALTRSNLLLVLLPSFGLVAAWKLF